MTWITVEVDVDLSDFDDSAIEAEYNDRKLGGGADPYEQCQRAYTLHHQGRKDEAYAILWEVCLDRVNKII